MFRAVLQRLPREKLRPLVVLLGTIIGMLYLYIWRLGSLTAGLSPHEAIARDASRYIQDITSYPLNAPLRLFQYGFQLLGYHGATGLRLPSAILMILFVACAYVLLRHWFGRLIGYLSVLLLASSPWIILTARSAGAEVLFLSPLAIIAGFLWLKRTKHTKIAWTGLMMLAAISLYIPGLIWFVIGAAILMRRSLIDYMKQLGIITILISTGLALLLIAPLLFAAVEKPWLIKSLLLIPNEWQGMLATLKIIGWSGLSLVLKTPWHTDLIIGQLGLLDTTQIVLAIFGFYAMWTKARSQTYKLLTVLAASVFAAGINNNLALLILAFATVSIFAAAGLRYLYVEWRSIFPHNPLPKTLALALMVILVGSHVFYGLRYSLVAWPHTSDTHSLYMIK